VAVLADEIVVLITASSKDEAATIGAALVQERLAACVNIVPEVRSLFFWEGKAQDERETLLIVKSSLPLLETLISRVKSLHSYSVPEVIALPIVGGSTDYLTWLRETTKR
jgi:periplasmic divalent cation tolerance protein